MNTTPDATIDDLSIGTAVRGTYAGTDFAGTVIGNRRHSIRLDVWEIYIALDVPTSFMGFSPRTGLFLYVGYDTKPNGFSCVPCEVWAA
jgi:hypothetical protein